MGFFDHPQRLPGIGDEQASPMLWYPRASTSGCRLSLDRTRSVPTSDQSAKSVIYVVPHESDIIECWSGEDWVPRRVPYDLGSTQTRNVLKLEISGCVDATNYDVYVRNVCGQWTIMHRAWPTTTRGSVPIHPDMHPDGLGMRDGRLVLGSWGGSVSDCQPSIDPTWLYLGTIRASAANQTEDSAAKRFVWNMYNRVPRPMGVTESTSSWTFSTASTFHQVNASSANQVAYVVGLSIDPVIATVWNISYANSGGVTTGGGVGVDSTSVNSAKLTGSYPVPTAILPSHGRYNGFPGLGYHYLAWLEGVGADVGGSTITWYGTNGTFWTTGLEAEVIG